MTKRMTVLLYRLRVAVTSTLLAFTAGAIFTAGQACPNFGFTSAAPLLADSYPATVASADFNGDGTADLVSANYLSETMAVSFGNGDGTFTAAVLFPNPGNPFSVAVGDINSDGSSDFVAGNAGSNDLTLWLGNGSGGFSSAGSLAVGATPFAVYLTEINGDAIRDLVSVNYGSNDISVLIGNGSGGFAPAMSSFAGIAPTSAAFADIDLNGTIDVIAANSSGNTFSVLSGNGNGTFGTPIAYTVGQFPQSVAAADLNGDGMIDVATANSGSGSVSVRLNQGGAFSSPISIAVGNMPFGIAAADLNSDGNADLATTNFFSNTVSVLLGAGDGSFASAQNFPVGSEPSSVVAADLNGDGSPDLATSNTGSNNISILLNNCVPYANTAPTIQSKPVMKQKGSVAARAAIAAVGDAEDPAAALTVTINGNGSATSNGVTVSGLTINDQGIVEADVTAACNASDAAFTLRVSDLGGLSAEAVLNVTVTPSRAPQISVLPAISLFPHNGKMRSVSMDQMLASVSDDCDADLSSNFVIERVTSDESSKKDVPIVIGSDCRSVLLLADRNNQGDGRVYSIRLRVKDSDGNIATADFTATVPLNPNSQASEGPPAFTIDGNCP